MNVYSLIFKKYSLFIFNYFCLFVLNIFCIMLTVSLYECVYICAHVSREQRQMKSLLPLMINVCKLDWHAGQMTDRQ